MEDKSKQLITPEERRLIKLLDVLKSAKVGGNLTVEKIELGSTREEYEGLEECVKQKLLESNNRMNEIDREIERLSVGQEKLKDALTTEREEIEEKYQDLVVIKNEIKKRLDELNEKLNNNQTEELEKLRKEVDKLKKSHTKSAKKQETSNRLEKIKKVLFNKKFLIIAPIVLFIVFLAIFMLLYVNYNSEKDLKFSALDGGYSVSGGKYFEASGTLTIPDTYKGQPIVEISANGFANFNDITEIVVPATVTKIGDGAFLGCKNLKAVTIKTNELGVSDLKTIGSRAFFGCNALFKIELPNGLENINDEAFAGTSLVIVTIPSSVEYVGRNAYMDGSVNKVIIYDHISVPDTWQTTWINSDVAIEYRLHIELDFGSGERQEETYAVYESLYSLPVPTRAGYAFDGWYCDGNAITTNDGASIVPFSYSQPIVATAYWTANINTLRFDANGGNGEIEPLEIATDGKAILPINTFTRMGYNFDGWATSANGQKVYDNQSEYTMGTNSEYVLYAVWVPVQYNITYELDGGDATNPTTYTAETNDFTLNEPTRKGYIFAGWSGADLGAITKTVKIVKGSSGDKTYIAHWELTQYTITYKLNGGEVTGNPTNFYITSEDFILVNPSRTGYTFAGWGGTYLNTPTMTVKIVKGSIGDRTYTANWTAITNTVTFHANGGSGTMSPQELATGSNENLSENSFIKNDSVFLGWATTANGSVIYNDKAEYTMGTNANYDLYAKWQDATPSTQFEISGSEVVKYIGSGGSVIIPEFINGKRITSIRSDAFKNCKNISSITIHSGITDIGKTIAGYEVFSGCSQLASITVYEGNTKFHSAGNCLIETESKKLISGSSGSVIPTDGSVTSIDYFAFRGSGIQNVSIPSSITKIGLDAFVGCSNLSSITVVAGNTKYHSASNCLIETLSKTLIVGCKNSVIPTDGSVTRIGSSAFVGCSGLTSITIPSSITFIGGNVNGCTAFSNCINLSNITVASGNSRYYSTGNCIIEASSKTLVVGCKNSVIPIDSSVTKIGGNAFLGCKNLTSIVIPNNITSVGVQAFSECDKLKSINFNGTKARWKSIVEWGWNLNTNDCTVTCTDGTLGKSESYIKMMSFEMGETYGIQRFIQRKVSRGIACCTG